MLMSLTQISPNLKQKYASRFVFGTAEEKADFRYSKWKILSLITLEIKFLH